VKFADYDKAIWLNPKFADAYNGRGSVYDDRGDRVRAIADFDQPYCSTRSTPMPTTSGGFIGIETFGGREQSEKGQRHDAIGPRDLHQQHGGKPAQAAGFDEVSLGGADRIAIDAASADLGAPAPFDGVIEPDHHRSAGRHQGPYQQNK